MENLLIALICLLLGGVLGWLICVFTTNSKLQKERAKAQLEINDIRNNFIGYQASTQEQLKSTTEQLNLKMNELETLKDLQSASDNQRVAIETQFTGMQARLNVAQETLIEKNSEIDQLKKEIKSIQSDWINMNSLLAQKRAENDSLEQKLEMQEQRMQDIDKKFNLEFENIANRILDAKTEKFTELNKLNLKSLLDPLGKNISDFQSRVNEVYDKESKERFSLAAKVKELAELNKVISEEAQNLTRALKGEAKTQGDWGQMILESILERSGLSKGREYVMEFQLNDEHGNPLRSDHEGKKMRPDAVIQYPDNRHVIIDAKVSLNAFTRFVAARDAKEQQLELAAHIAAIKNHIVSLSVKGYDDYDKALDFVMMFVPSEPAYIAALQGDAELWNFAYDKRILLLSPTNLITSLKLIVDLWKREYQNRNAQQIAERGSKLYDKFVSFIDNLQGIGQHLEKAQGKYADAFRQLSTGNDNLVSQASKLKGLGVKTKKSLAEGLVENSKINE